MTIDLVFFRTLIVSETSDTLVGEEQFHTLQDVEVRTNQNTEVLQLTNQRRDPVVINQSEKRSCDKRPIMFQDLTPDHHNVPSLLSVPPDHLSQFIINYNVSMPAGQDTAWCEEKNCYSGINQSGVTILLTGQSQGISG